MRLDDLAGDKCPICSIEMSDFRDARRIYCSLKCQRRARVLRDIAKRKAVRATFTCAQCGEYLTNAKSAVAIYCSLDCRQDAGERQRKRDAERAKLKAARDAKIEGRECEFCAAHLPHSSPVGTRFCGSRCRDNARYAKEPAAARAAVRVCARCGGRIDPSRPMQARHCSTRCRRKKPPASPVMAAFEEAQTHSAAR